MTWQSTGGKKTEQKTREGAKPWAPLWLPLQHHPRGARDTHSWQQGRKSTKVFLNQVAVINTNYLNINGSCSLKIWFFMCMSILLICLCVCHGHGVPMEDKGGLQVPWIRVADVVTTMWALETAWPGSSAGGGFVPRADIQGCHAWALGALLSPLETGAPPPCLGSFCFPASFLLLSALHPTAVFILKDPSQILHSPWR